MQQYTAAQEIGVEMICAEEIAVNVSRLSDHERAENPVTLSVDIFLNAWRRFNRSKKRTLAVKGSGV